jgi:hypothetical protein
MPEASNSEVEREQSSIFNFSSLCGSAAGQVAGSSNRCEVAGVFGRFRELDF